jgi:hypothetical protein
LSSNPDAAAKAGCLADFFIRADIDVMSDLGPFMAAVAEGGGRKGNAKEEEVCGQQSQKV